MKRYFQTIVKWLLRTLLVFASLLVLYVAAAVVLSWIPKQQWESTDCTQQPSAYLSTNGVHIDIILPKNALSPELAQGLDLAPNTHLVAFGWGDAGFYLNTPTWADLEWNVAVNAVFMASPTLMHVTQYSHTRENWIELQLCETQLDSLHQHLQGSFALSQQGQKQVLPGKGYGQNDAFFKANGHYRFWYTCNTWANEGLQAAGFTTALWTPFDFGVLRWFE